MPELPEVETIKNGLSDTLIGRVVSDITISGKNMRRPWPSHYKNIIGQTIIRLDRRAKYLCIYTDDYRLIIHLGMSGRLLINHPNIAHTHATIYLNNNNILYFIDPRRFGFLDIVSRETTPLYFSHLGVEPLTNDLNADYLFLQLKHKKTTIKQCLFNQHIIVGLGNIYICEALFSAAIHPTRSAHTLSYNDITVLIQAIKNTLLSAIQQGGSTLKDYQHHDGNLGYFQHNFQAYDQANQPCSFKNCHGVIERFTQQGRSSYACNHHQI